MNIPNKAKLHHITLSRQAALPSLESQPSSLSTIYNQFKGWLRCHTCHNAEVSSFQHGIEQLFRYLADITQVNQTQHSVNTRRQWYQRTFKISSGVARCKYYFTLNAVTQVIKLDQVASQAPYGDHTA
jgi:hypothetical protein